MQSPISYPSWYRLKKSRLYADIKWQHRQSKVSLSDSVTNFKPITDRCFHVTGRFGGASDRGGSDRGGSDRGGTSRGGSGRGGSDRGGSDRGGSGRSTLREVGRLRACFGTYPENRCVCMILKEKVRLHLHVVFEHRKVIRNYNIEATSKFFYSMLNF